MYGGGGSDAAEAEAADDADAADGDVDWVREGM